jgi:CRP-like cAMP-binding protein
LDKYSTNRTCDLKSCYLCQLSLKSWLPAIEVHRKNVFVKKGQSIFKEGDQVTGIYFVYDGTVKVYKKWDKEKDLTIRFAKKGDILGHLGLGKQSVYPVSAIALEPAMVCYISLEFFESTLMVNHQLTYNLLLFFADQLQQSEQRMRDLVHMSVKGRIAHALLALHEQFGANENGFLDIEISRQDLASFAGVVYETLFKVMNEFVQKNLIALHGKKIHIVNRQGLEVLTHQS